MKRLSLVLGMVFLGGFVFAQNNVATVTETGKSNAGYVQQQGELNTATITQVGDNNLADVGDVFASSLYGLLTGAKGVTQVGDKNTGTINQINALTGTLAGDGPKAGMLQVGNINTATINQSHNSLWMQEYAWVQQVGDNNTSLQNQASLYGFSHVLQQGNLNNAETQQVGGYNQKANIWQAGNGNKAKQAQGFVGYTEINLAEATQIGNSNESLQEQYGSNNIAKTVQSGDLNIADISQTGAGTHKAYINQYGNGNEVKGLLGIGSAIQDGLGHMLTVNQFGNNNDGWVSQIGTSQTGTITQTGNSNVSTVNQSN